MKKFALLFVAACSFSCVGLTGCGGSGDTKVIEAPATTEPEMTPEQQAEMDKGMEALYNQGGN